MRAHHGSRFRTLVRIATALIGTGAVVGAMVVATPAAWADNGGSGSSATRYVDNNGHDDSDNDCSTQSDPCLTIQHANDEADDGDTIQVAAGTYGDSKAITIDKSVTLEGAQAGNDPTSSRSGDETTIKGTNADNGDVAFVLINGADDVTIDGFMFTHTAGVYSEGISKEHGVIVLKQPENGSVARSVTIQNNVFHDVSGRPILKNSVDAAVNTVDIVSNVFRSVKDTTDPDKPSDRTAIKLRFKCDASDAANTCGGTIEGNVIDNISTNGINVDDAAGFTITGNTITNIAGYGIGVRSRHPENGPVEITGNVLSDVSTDLGQGIGIRIKDKGHYNKLTLTGNTIKNSNLGLSVESGNMVKDDATVEVDGTTLSSVVDATGSTFQNNGIAVKVGPNDPAGYDGVIVDARQSTWGSATPDYDSLVTTADRTGFRYQDFRDNGDYSVLVGPWELGGSGDVSLTQPMCTPGAVYALGDHGQMFEVMSGRVAPIGESADSVTKFNGLGIGANGSPVYAYNRIDNLRGVQLYKYDTTAGTWQKLDGQSLKTTNTDREVVFVAGAVDPITETYYFGGFDKTGANTVFRLWKYDGGSISYVGDTSIQNGTNQGENNGDIAFDAAGNLLIVWNHGSVTTIVGVTAQNLAVGGSMQNTPSDGHPTLSKVNGVAFGSDGIAYLGTGTTVQSYSTADWESIKELTSNLSGSADLASCSSAPTLTLQKDFTGRVNDTDQVTLTLTQGDSQLGEATTSGTDTGIQSAAVGPVLAASGTEYTVTETAAGTGDDLIDFADYDVSYQCTANDETIAGSTGTEGTVIIPDGGAVVCTFTNSPKDTTQPTPDPDPAPGPGPDPAPDPDPAPGPAPETTSVAPGIESMQCMLADNVETVSVTPVEVDGIEYTTQPNDGGSVTVIASLTDTDDYKFADLDGTGWTLSHDGDTATRTITASDVEICVGGESQTEEPGDQQDEHDAEDPSDIRDGADAISPDSDESADIVVKGELAAAPRVETVGSNDLANTGINTERLVLIVLMLLAAGGTLVLTDTIRRRSQLRRQTR